MAACCAQERIMYYQLADTEQNAPQLIKRSSKPTYVLTIIDMPA